MRKRPRAWLTPPTIPLDVASHLLALLFNIVISSLFGKKFIAAQLPHAHHIPNVPLLAAREM